MIGMMDDLMPLEPSQPGNVLEYQVPARARRNPYKGTWVLRIVLLCIACALFGIAYYFGSMPPFQQTPRSQQAGTQIAPNVTAGLTSLGFSLAGASAVLACALVRPDPPADAE
jgi:hypothetical protein